MKKIALVVVALATFASANPWTECGLGGAIASFLPAEKAAAGKAVASVTNIIWDLGTTATTSAVSTPDLCANKAVAAAKFINDTYASLETETAKGEGQNLSALMDIAGVEASARGAIVASLRTGLANELAVGAAKSDVEKAQAFYAVFMAALAEQA